MTEPADEKQYHTVAYSALTLVLLVFILQSGFSLVVNILRNVDIYYKLQRVKTAHNVSLKSNVRLKSELNSFNSAKSLETIARNNLKMAGRNEILLIINKKLPDKKDDKNTVVKPPKEKGIFYKR